MHIPVSAPRPTCLTAPLALIPNICTPVPPAAATMMLRPGQRDERLHGCHRRRRAEARQQNPGRSDRRAFRRQPNRRERGTKRDRKRPPAGAQEKPWHLRCRASIAEAINRLEARRKVERLLLELGVARATIEQLDALQKVTDEEEHIHHHGDEKSKTVLSGKSTSCGRNSATRSRWKCLPGSSHICRW